MFGRVYIAGEEKRLRLVCAAYQRAFRMLARWVRSWPLPD